MNECLYSLHIFKEWCETLCALSDLSQLAHGSNILYITVCCHSPRTDAYCRFYCKNKL